METNQAQKKKFGGKQEGSGRPPKPIDWNIFEELCAIQCTQIEIAGVFRIDVDTLRERVFREYKKEYSAVYKELSEEGKSSLRRYQFNLSKTNAAMAIWLGKQWLGQTDPDKKYDLPVTEKQAEDFNKFMDALEKMQKDAQKN